MTTTRPDELQAFLDECLTAFENHAADPHTVTSLARVRAALERPGETGDTTGVRLPVCDLLDQVARPECFDAPDLRRMIAAFRVLEPQLTWRRRSGDMARASANIADGHANGVIVGPGGLERRTDVWLGVTLLAPHMRYPDHTHPPEETYLVLSEGEFRHGDSGWFTPGIGGSFYNEPGIEHAMRSGEAPLFAFWVLWAQT